MKHILIAVVATFVLGGSPVDAGGGSIPPSAYKLVEGSENANADPLVEMAADDNDYYLIASRDRSTGHAVVLKTAFSDIPDVGDSSQLDVLLLAKGSPTCSVKMWHWRKDRFVPTGTPAVVTGTETNLSVLLEPASPFVRKGKARAKLSCLDDDPYLLAVDMQGFTP